MSETLVDTLLDLEVGDKVRFANANGAWKTPFFVEDVSDYGGRSVTVENGGVRYRLDLFAGDIVLLVHLRERDENVKGRLTELENVGRASTQKLLRMADPEDLGLSPRTATDGGRP